MTTVFRSQGAAIVSAFLIAPLGPGIWGGAWALIAGRGDGIPPDGFIIMLFYLVALPIGIILGLPALFLLAKTGRLACWTATLMGVIAGLIISSLLHLPIALYAPIGPAWAIAFYSVWKMGPEPTNTVAINWVRNFFGRRG
jgi:hypothetical protein